MYRMRWMSEVSFRNLKQTLDTHILRCKSSPMIVKELWMNLIGYNALCYLQVQAAKVTKTTRAHLSFKGCLQVIRAWEYRFRDWRRSSRATLGRLYKNMVEKLLVIRPNRFEPRVNKRRPKIIRLMMKPRRELRTEMLKSFPGGNPIESALS